MPDKDKGYVKFPDGTEFDIPMHVYEGIEGQQLQNKIKFDIGNRAEKLGEPLVINIPGYQGNYDKPPKKRIESFDDIPVPLTMALPGAKGVLDKLGIKAPSATIGAPRGAMDFTGEFIGGTAGGIGGGVLGAPGGLPGVIAGAAAGAGAGGVAGKGVSRKLQELAGAPAKPYPGREMLTDFAINAAGEGGGRLLQAPWRALKWSARAGGSASKARANLNKLVGAGVPHPPAYLVLKDTGAWYSPEAFAKFLAEHPGSAEIVEAGSRGVSDALSDSYEQMWMIPRGRGFVLPSRVQAGKAYAKGGKRVLEALKTKVDYAYAALDEKLPAETLVRWDNARKAAQESGAFDPTRRAWVSPQGRQWLADMEAAFVTPASGQLGEQVQKIPYDKLKKLRTTIDDQIAEWVPGGNVKQSELLDFREALTKDMEAAARQANALDEFQEANRLAHERFKIKEEVFLNIGKAEKRHGKLGKVIESFVKGDEYDVLGAIKSELGKDSQEWMVIRNYTMTEIARGTEGFFDIQRLARFFNKKSRTLEGMKSVLLGSKDNTERQAVENLIEVYNKWGKAVQQNPGGTPSMVWNRARMYGPLAGIGALGAGAGYASGGEDRGFTDAALGAALFMGLSTMGAKRAARLIMNQKFSEWVSSAPNLTLNAGLGTLGRLGLQMQTEPPETQKAFLEFLAGMNEVAGMSMQQQRPGQMPGVISGGR